MNRGFSCKIPISTQEPFLLTSIKGEVLYINKIMSEILNLDLEDKNNIIYSNILTSINIKEKINECIQNTKFVTFEIISNRYLYKIKLIPAEEKKCLMLLDDLSEYSNFSNFLQKTNKDIVKSYKYLEKVLTNISAVVYSYRDDDKTGLNYISASLEDVLGYTRREAFNDINFYPKLVHPEHKNIYLNHVEKIRNSKKSISEYKIKHKNGYYIWIRDEGKLVGREHDIIGFFTDITESKKEEKQTRSVTKDLMYFEKLFRGFVKALPYSCAMFENDRLVYANREYYNTRHLPKGNYDFINKVLEDKKFQFIHPDDYIPVSEIYERVANGEQITLKRRIRGKSQTEFKWYETHFIVTESFGKKVRIELDEDITLKIENDKKILELEKKNSVIATAITANHELNQPLTVIRWVVDLFKDNFKKYPVTEEDKDNLLKLDQSIERMERILDKLRNLSSIAFTDYVFDTKMLSLDKE